MAFFIMCSIHCRRRVERNQNKKRPSHSLCLQCQEAMVHQPAGGHTRIKPNNIVMAGPDSRLSGSSISPFDSIRARSAMLETPRVSFFTTKPRRSTKVHQDEGSVRARQRAIDGSMALRAEGEQPW
jgi:hypothetical protein